MTETLARSVDRASGSRRLRQSLLILGMTTNAVKATRKGYVAISGARSRQDVKKTMANRSLALSVRPVAVGETGCAESASFVDSTEGVAVSATGFGEYATVASVGTFFSCTDLFTFGLQRDQ